MACVFDAFLARPVAAASAARELLEAPPTPSALAFAGWGLVTAGGALGRWLPRPVAFQQVDTTLHGVALPVGLGVEGPRLDLRGQVYLVMTWATCG